MKVAIITKNICNFLHKSSNSIAFAKKVNYNFFQGQRFLSIFFDLQPKGGMAKIKSNMHMQLFFSLICYTVSFFHAWFKCAGNSQIAIKSKVERKVIESRRTNSHSVALAIQESQTKLQILIRNISTQNSRNP